MHDPLYLLPCVVDLAAVHGLQSQRFEYHVLQWPLHMDGLLREEGRGLTLPLTAETQCTWLPWAVLSELFDHLSYRKQTIQLSKFSFRVSSKGHTYCARGEPGNKASCIYLSREKQLLTMGVAPVASTSRPTPLPAVSLITTAQEARHTLTMWTAKMTT